MPAPSHTPARAAKFNRNADCFANAGSSATFRRGQMAECPRQRLPQRGLQNPKATCIAFVQFADHKPAGNSAADNRGQMAESPRQRVPQRGGRNPNVKTRCVRSFLRSEHPNAPTARRRQMGKHKSNKWQLQSRHCTHSTRQFFLVILNAAARRRAKAKEKRT